MISITLQCSCGQLFVFDVEPVNGQMPCTVACPTCGVDATHAANQEVHRLVSQAVPPAATPVPDSSAPAAPPAASKEKNTLMIGVLCTAIVVLVGLVGGVYYWVNYRSDGAPQKQTIAAVPSTPITAPAPPAPAAAPVSNAPVAVVAPKDPPAKETAKPAKTTKRDPSYVAVGALFDRDLKTQNVEITRIVPNSPAKKAGIVVGDILISVDDTSIREMKLKEIADMFYGPVGSKLTLELVSAKSGATNRVTMVRKKFH